MNVPADAPHAIPGEGLIALIVLCILAYWYWQ